MTKTRHRRSHKNKRKTIKGGNWLFPTLEEKAAAAAAEKAAAEKAAAEKAAAEKAAAEKAAAEKAAAEKAATPVAATPVAAATDSWFSWFTGKQEPNTISGGNRKRRSKGRKCSKK